jgi:SagB-type dehydrogenase family enzyme
MNKGPGERFQEETKYTRGKLPGGPLIWSAKPKTYKTYPDAPRVALDPPDREGGVPLWQAIAHRQSIRNFQNKPLGMAQMSQLLWATQGIAREQMGFEFRAAPSAGALYPIETYVVAHNAEHIEQGIYHYAVRDHQLEQIKKGDFRMDIAKAALDQDMAYSASAVFVWTAVFARATWKYGQRAYRYVYLDTGHIAMNFGLTAVALGLGSCQIGALYDGESNTLLGIDGKEESTLYMSVVGHPI